MNIYNFNISGLERAAYKIRAGDFEGIQNLLGNACEIRDSLDSQNDYDAGWIQQVNAVVDILEEKRLVAYEIKSVKTRIFASFLFVGSVYAALPALAEGVLP